MFGMRKVTVQSPAFPVSKLKVICKKDPNDTPESFRSSASDHMLGLEKVLAVMNPQKLCLKDFIWKVMWMTGARGCPGEILPV